MGVYIRDIKDLVNDIPKVTLAGSRLGMEHLHFYSHVPVAVRALFLGLCLFHYPLGEMVQQHPLI